MNVYLVAAPSKMKKQNICKRCSHFPQHLRIIPHPPTIKILDATPFFSRDKGTYTEMKKTRQIKCKYNNK